MFKYLMCQQLVTLKGTTLDKIQAFSKQGKILLRFKSGYE